MLTKLDLEPVLFAGSGGVLDSWDARPVPGLSTCRWEARPKDRADAPPRVVTLAFYRLSDAREAQRQLDRQPHGSDRSTSSAMTDNDDDALVRSGNNQVGARHGANLAVLDAHGANLADPAQPEVRYLLDALALKAAGAAVKPAPWAMSRRSAGWAPLTSQPGNGAADVDWRPPANPSASSSAAADWLLNIAVLILRHGFVMLFAGIFGPIIVGALFAPSDGSTGPRRSRMALAVPVLAVLIANLVFGTAIASQRLHSFGTSAAATITGSYETSTQYNEHTVVGYHVLLRSPDGTAVATSFEDDDFNVYPPHNATRYPGPGDVFTVRYLRRFPGDFTIVADDASPWARAGQCALLTNTLAKAEQRAAFSYAARDRAVALATGRAVGVTGCPGGS